MVGLRAEVARLKVRGYARRVAVAMSGGSFLKVEAGAGGELESVCPGGVQEFGQAPVLFHDPTGDQSMVLAG
jgi:hypothetical protein